MEDWRGGGLQKGEGVQKNKCKKGWYVGNGEINDILKVKIQIFTRKMMQKHNIPFNFNSYFYNEIFKFFFIILQFWELNFTLETELKITNLHFIEF